MIKNITVYLCLLISLFVFNIFYYAWFSWYLLVAVLCLPLLSLALSLPFMIISAVKGFVVFSKDTVCPGDDFYIGVCARKSSAPFCPLLRIKFRAENNFAGQKDKVSITYGGTLTKAVFVKYNKLAKHCGMLTLSAKYCKVYDIMGIFFIPVRINTKLEVNIIPKPKKPALIPNYENVAVLGYKPKKGGGFSDFYELRQYQHGDSLKNIHWKLTSKHDDIIVREPNLPIYKKLTIMLVLTDNSTANDSILARFLYACGCLFKDGSDCLVMCNKINYVSKLANQNDAQAYLKSLYRGTAFNEAAFDQNDVTTYSIFGDGEEVG